MSNCLVLNLETTRVLFPKSCRCAMLHWTLLFVQIPTVDSACLIHLKSHWPETLLTARLQEKQRHVYYQKFHDYDEILYSFSEQIAFKLAEKHATSNYQ